MFTPPLGAISTLYGARHRAFRKHSRPAASPTVAQPLVDDGAEPDPAGLRRRPGHGLPHLDRPSRFPDLLVQGRRTASCGSSIRAVSNCRSTTATACISPPATSRRTPSRAVGHRFRDTAPPAPPRHGADPPGCAGARAASGAELVVGITIAEVFVNCPRYVHRYRREATSASCPGRTGPAPCRPGSASTCSGTSGPAAIGPRSRRTRRVADPGRVPRPAARGEDVTPAPSREQVGRRAPPTCPLVTPPRKPAAPPPPPRGRGEALEVAVCARRRLAQGGLDRRHDGVGAASHPPRCSSIIAAVQMATWPTGLADALPRNVRRAEPGRARTARGSVPRG